MYKIETKDNNTRELYNTRSLYCVGILGGAFSPPHVGHLYIAEASHKIIKTKIWWTVTWRNILKNRINEKNFIQRVEAVRRLIKDSNQQRVCEIEKSVRSCCGLQTIRALRRRYRRNSFVWIMGVDSFLNLHRWHRAREFIKETPIIVVSRAQYNDKNVMTCKSAVMARRGYRRSVFDFVLEAKKGLDMNCLWTHLRVRPMLVSSTVIRNRGTYFHDK